MKGVRLFSIVLAVLLIAAVAAVAFRMPAGFEASEDYTEEYSCKEQCVIDGKTAADKCYSANEMCISLCIGYSEEELRELKAEAIACKEQCDFEIDSYEDADACARQCLDDYEARKAEFEAKKICVSACQGALGRCVDSARAKAEACVASC